MQYKSRSKPKELIILESLNNRMNLKAEDKQHYSSLKKGYEGEVLFDNLTKKLQCECYILNDLLFEVKNTTFQMDTLIITKDIIYLYEIKNFEGDYYYEADKLYKKPKLEIINPFHQMSRAESLLRHLLHRLNYTLPINASVVFINPTFTLYQAPLDLPSIFPTQVNTHISQLNIKPSKLTDRHKKLADQLVDLHITDSPYRKIPSYDYGKLRKGISCAKCHSFSVFIENRSCLCIKCNYKESTDKAVLRTITEFQFLFPAEKLTTNITKDWCQVVQSKKTLRRILSNNFNTAGVKKATFYHK